MRADNPRLEWLENPEVFAVNRMDPFSDHTFYVKTPKDLEISLNGNWKFHLSKNPASRPADFYTPGYDTSSWDSIQVPGEVQMQGYLKNHYTNTIYPWDGHDDIRPPKISQENNAVASYVTTFDLPENYIDYEQILTFHGVETAFYVWCNGEFVGYAEDSFTPSHFDISAYVQEKDNVLSVEVYQRSSASWLEDQDMWRFMGIFRDVTISLWPRIHIEDIKTIQTIDFENQSAFLQVECKNRVGCAGDVEASLWYGGTCLSTKSDQAADENHFDFSVADVKLWSAEKPELYTLRFVVKTGDTILEQAALSIGFREVKIEDGILKLNNQRLQFHGMNRHEFACDTGRALSRDVMDFDAAFMKRNNINAVRTSHYPNASYWYDLADRMGLYLIDETNLETHGSWQKLGVLDPSWNIPGNLKEWEAAVLDRAKNMYERDKNHPSIVIWSLGNESYGGTGLIAMHDMLAKLDPSRPIHYEGTTWCRQYEQATDIESRMYAKPHEIEEYLTNNPQKPYISCEYEHAMGNSLGNMQEYMDLEKYPHYQGGFIWDYVDQAILTEENGKKVFKYGGDFDDYPNDGNFCGDGVLFADRSETPKVQEMKQLYRFVNLEPTAAGVSITNNYLFDNLEDMEFIYTQKVDGEILTSGCFRIQLDPGKTTFVEIPWQKEPKAGIYTRTVDMQLAKDKPWAKAGLPLAFGQNVLVKKSLPCLEGSVKCVQGDGNVGVYGDGFGVYFQYQKGLVSLKYDGKEMLRSAVRPDFFRAFTDNDEGAGYPAKAGIWMAAGMFARIKDVQVVPSSHRVQVVYTYALPFVNETAYLTYTVHGSGVVEASLDLELVNTDTLLPAFGLRFALGADMDQVSFFGKGPMDTYIDRNHAKLDLYETTLAKSYVDYLKPQEHGSHTDTWWMQVNNACNQGLRFTARNMPFQASAGFYTPEELQNAAHKEELPQPYQCVVRILSDQMGVGGDDTWGAPVHDAYLIDPTHPLHLSLFISKAE